MTDQPISQRADDELPKQIVDVENLIVDCAAKLDEHDATGRRHLVEAARAFVAAGMEDFAWDALDLATDGLPGFSQRIYGAGGRE